MRRVFIVGFAVLSLAACSDSGSDDGTSDGAAGSSTGGASTGGAGGGVGAAGGSGGSSGSGGGATGGSGGTSGGGGTSGSPGAGGVAGSPAGGTGGQAGAGAGGQAGSAGQSGGGAAGSAGAGGNPGGPFPCTFPFNLEPSRLIYACDIDDAVACRFYHPQLVTDPLCGDNDSWNIRFFRASMSPTGHSLRVPTGWTVISGSHGQIDFTTRNLQQLIEDTAITARIDDGAGTQYDVVFQFNSATSSITVTSITVV